MKKYKTYKGSGIRQDKIKIAEEIRKIMSVAGNLESNPKNIGMFAGVYEPPAIDWRAAARKEIGREIVETFGEKRAPYILATCFLMNRLEEKGREYL